MDSNIDTINNIVRERALPENEGRLAKECMLELCSRCDTQETLTKLDDLFLNLSDGIILFDVQLDFINANKKGRSIFENFVEFYYQDQGYKLTELPFIQRTLKEMQAGEATVVAKNKDDSLRTFHLVSSITYSPVSEPIGICIVINDVTEVQSQARQLEDMMASLTHDLKTPLIAAETNIRHMLEGYYGDLSNGQKQILELMLGSNATALKLVKNLLSVFKYETGSYNLLLKPIRLDKLINTAIDFVKPLADEKKISIITEHFDPNYILDCDHFEIERVLTNLLTNAIRFSQPPAHIIIKSSLEQDSLIISVEDSGVGIASDKLDTLFTRFSQTKLQEANSNSTGLGLYLSRQIVEAHGGKIWAESEINKGTKVFFSVPVNYGK